MTIAEEIKKSFDAHVINKKNGTDQEETFAKAIELGEETEDYENSISYFKFKDGSKLSYDLFDLWTVII